MKYVVAYKVPPYVSGVIESSYERVTGRKLPAHNLHISLIYPFNIYENYSEDWVLEKLKSYEFKSIDSRLSRIDVFEQKKKLLYISVKPEEDYMANHLVITRILRPGIHIDNKTFLKGELPKYDPHIGVDYDFDGDHLTLHSLRVERIEAWFDSGYPRLFRFDKDVFEEVVG